MTVDNAVQWVAWTTKQPVEKLMQTFTPDQLVQLGKWLCNNRLLNPPQQRKVKQLTMICQCGCNQRFTVQYAGGRKPIYMNDAHRIRAYRARRRAREM